MAKGSLTFELPQERDEFEQAQKAGAYQAALHELWNWARALDKYSDQTTVTVGELRAKISEILNDYEVDV